jgi:hypothetical protein
VLISAKDTELLGYYAMPDRKFTKQHGVTLQNTWIFSNSTVRTSNLALMLGVCNNATTNHFNSVCITFLIQNYTSIF